MLDLVVKPRGRGRGRGFRPTPSPPSPSPSPPRRPSTSPASSISSTCSSLSSTSISSSLFSSSPPASSSFNDLNKGEGEEATPRPKVLFGPNFLTTPPGLSMEIVKDKKEPIPGPSSAMGGSTKGKGVGPTPGPSSSLGKDKGVGPTPGASARPSSGTERPLSSWEREFMQEVVPMIFPKNCVIETVTLRDFKNPWEEEKIRMVRGRGRGLNPWMKEVTLHLWKKGESWNDYPNELAALPENWYTNSMRIRRLDIPPPAPMISLDTGKRVVVIDKREQKNLVAGLRLPKGITISRVEHFDADDLWDKWVKDQEKKKWDTPPKDKPEVLKVKKMRDPYPYIDCLRTKKKKKRSSQGQAGSSSGLQEPRQGTSKDSKKKEFDIDHCWDRYELVKQYEFEPFDQNWGGGITITKVKKEKTD